MTNREMDALIAEKVFGWRWKRDQEFIKATGEKIGKPWRFIVAPNFVLWELSDADGSEEINETYQDVPRFTEDPAASKQLREKLAELGWKSQRLIRTDYGAFYLVLENGKQERIVGDSEQEEFLAVALCALKSVGIQ